MTTTISPLAPKTTPAMPVIAGLRFATAAAAIRYKGRTDVMLALFDRPAAVAGVFTTSKCPSAPVDWCRARLAGGTARALLVNSGNANAFTGMKGRAAAALSAGIAAKAAGCAVEEIFLASTGVIGEPLDATKFEPVIDDLVAAAAADNWQAAARAIMTTDTFPKLATASADLAGTTVSVNGFAKGAGMIAPDMATMLAFLFTDAAVAAPVLQALLSEEVGATFNSVTIDSDTSTSDTLLLFATGAADMAAIETLDDPRVPALRRALAAVMADLAKQVARDGEGARKFLEITVTGAETDQSAKKIALSIANSPLVKTAAAGEDANWGRIVMAVGKAGEPADRDRLQIWFGDIRVATEGARDPDYNEAIASAYMRNDEIAIRVDLGLGQGAATVWTCDLTKEYVAINGDYRT